MVTLNLCLLHVIAKYRQSLPLYSSLSKSIRPFYYFLDSDAGRDWGQEEKGMTEDEMAGWHHWLDGCESEWTLGVGDGQGGLACCDSWGRKESDMTEWLNWTEHLFHFFFFFLLRKLRLRELSNLNTFTQLVELAVGLKNKSYTRTMILFILFFCVMTISAKNDNFHF